MSLSILAVGTIVVIWQKTSFRSEVEFEDRGSLRDLAAGGQERSLGVL
jgi:hypothetical protein